MSKETERASDKIFGIASRFLFSSLLSCLALILCSQTQQICMPPHQWPELFNSQYDCLMFGYKESQKKMKEIGRKEVNEHSMFIRFTCTPQNTI